MIAFVYLVGIVVSFIACAYFDVKGMTLLDLKPREKIRGTTKERLLLGAILVFMWPVSVVTILTMLMYDTLLGFFKRPPQKPKLWGCPKIRPAAGYLDPIERCNVKTKSRNKPKCGVHHCEMVEEK